MFEMGQMTDRQAERERMGKRCDYHTFVIALMTSKR